MFVERTVGSLGTPSWSGTRLTVTVNQATNAAAPGAPSVAGAAREGETLTSARGTTADGNGLPADDAALIWKWVRQTLCESNKTPPNVGVSAAKALIDLGASAPATTRRPLELDGDTVLVALEEVRAFMEANYDFPAELCAGIDQLRIDLVKASNGKAAAE